MLNSHYFDCFERTPSMSFKTHFKNVNNFFNKQIVQLLHKNSLLLGYKSQLLQIMFCVHYVYIRSRISPYLFIANWHKSNNRLDTQSTIFKVQYRFHSSNVVFSLLYNSLMLRMLLYEVIFQNVKYHSCHINCMLYRTCQFVKKTYLNKNSQVQSILSRTLQNPKSILQLFVILAKFICSNLYSCSCKRQVRVSLIEVSHLHQYIYIQGKHVFVNLRCMTEIEVNLCTENNEVKLSNCKHTGDTKCVTDLINCIYMVNNFSVYIKMWFVITNNYILFFCKCYVNEKFDKLV